MNGRLTRRTFVRLGGLGIYAWAAGRGWTRAWAAGGEPPGKPGRLNVLLITADDLNCDSVGAYGCTTPETTPNLDRLAREGMRFTRSHVTIAVCQPCRSVLMTGRYPHRCGGEGFHRIRNTNVPTLVELLSQAGYHCGILGKVGHSTPKASIRWDMQHDARELGAGRDPARYGQFAKGFLQQAAARGRPFFLMANSHDPHRPFAGSDQEKARFKGRSVCPPSRVYRPAEVRVPGFLPELPPVRREIAEYYGSVRRCDDTVGALLKALADSGQADNTLVIFLSDHGMALPFAKTNCYLHSTRSPWIVRWPGKVPAGRADDEHFISGIDLMPTILSAAGLKLPEGMDGFSFLPVLRGEKQAGRTMVFTQFHQTSARRRYPIRAVQNRRFGYLFNPWSDGQRVFRNESQSGRTFKAMRAAAATDAKIAARVRHFLYRTVEEFYDYETDPDALHNLVGEARYRKQIDELRGEMERWMRRTGDPALEAFRKRESPAALREFMAEQDKQAGRGRKRRAKS
jgi:N-sulfoglucosamine sulfohydrolase